MAETGASLSEQLLEASRRNNTELLLTIKSELGNDQIKLAELINSSKDIMGNSALHLACKSGNWEVIDIILDIEGVEIDPRNKIDGDTPLHVAARYANEEPEHGTFIIDNLCDAGSDPRIRNDSNQKPIDLVDDSNTALKDLLESDEYAISMEHDPAVEVIAAPEEDEGEASASDSDN